MTRPCRETGCPFPAQKGLQRCGWHALLRKSIAEQEVVAQRRLAAAEGYHARRPPVDGGRWCSGCQSYIPDCYVSGSKCVACARRARRASHVERTYDISAEEVAQLKIWQGNRCFVCGRRAVTRELAVDHDHVTGRVRGLLCSDAEWGCNVTLRRLLDDPGAAERLLAYTVETPLERMRSGDEPWFEAHRVVDPPAVDDDVPPF